MHDNISKVIDIYEKCALRKEDFLRDPLTIRINKDIEFALIIRNFNSKTPFTDFQLDIKTEIYGTMLLSAIITLESPKGPQNDIIIILNGCLSKNNISMKTKHETNFLRLDKLSFFCRDFIIMKIQIKSINQNTSSLFVKKALSTREIEKKIQNETKITNAEFSWLSSSATAILLSQPSLIYLSPPIVIVGDIYGKFLDLDKIFMKFGFPGIANYLFLGNYSSESDVPQSETLALLLAYKIKSPNNIFLLRGQQECEYSSKHHEEDDSIGFTRVFRALPFAAIVGNKIFCVHSGISPQIPTLSSIENIVRPCDFSDISSLSNLIFSKPNPSIQLYSTDANISYYGTKAVQDFNKRFMFELIVRSNKFFQTGYDITFPNNSLVSIFSASNVQNQNKGAVMVVGKNLEYLFYNYFSDKNDIPKMLAERHECESAQE